MQINVRAAHESDVAWLLLELKSFAAFYGTQLSLMPSDDEAEMKLHALIADHVFLVAESGNERLGFIAGLLSPHFMNQAITCLSELFWWVKEEHRGSRAGLALLNEFLRIGETSADWITFTLEHHSPVSDKALLNRGFRIQERSYLKEIF